MSEKRKCVNCRHRILNEATTSNKCEIDGHRIDYAECFDGSCRHWAKQKIDEREVPKSLTDLDMESTVWLLALASLSGIIEEQEKEQDDEQTASED
jgi:hypothetical protein